MKARKLLFVINPKSGGNRNPDLTPLIRKLLPDDELFFVETEGKDDQQKIKKAIAENDPDIVVAAGGDGTIQLVAHCILDKDIILGILPTGSANGLATELQIPDEMSEAIRLLTTDHYQRLDILCINEEWISLHLSDLGFNARLVRYFEQAGQRGKLGYARHFIRTLFTQKAVRYFFRSGSEQFTAKAQMVAFANARMYGTGAVINPDGILDDRKFEICIFKPYPWYAIFGITIRFFVGGLKQSPYVRIHSVEYVEVDCERPEVLQIDGEDMGEMSRVTVKLHKRQLTIITPENIG